MRIPLQQIDHTDSAYERPNQDWVCGWARDGHPCKLGPDGKGQCTARAQATCTPVKEGARWVCTRADVFGGTCNDGPLPDGTCACPPPEQQVCQPVRSMRARRALTVKLTVIFALGILLIGFAGPWQLKFASPGQLSASHMAIQGEPGAENCSSCHVSGEVTFGTWVKTALSSTDFNNSATHQSEQCLTCHFSADPTSATAALRVHSRTKAMMASTAAVETEADDTAEAETSSDAATDTPAEDAVAGSDGLVDGLTSLKLSLASTLHGPADFNSENIACASCHHEHMGKSNDMTAMTDAQCQVCHASSFESFNNGHPAFSPVTHDNPGIIFDHAEHTPRFENGELQCNRCHTPDPLGLAMQVKPFEDTCQGCHEQGSTDHHGDAIKKNPLAVLQLPAIEFEDEVYWPEDGAYAEVLTPMMTLLLAGDDEAVPVLNMIKEEAFGDLFEWQLLLEDFDQPELKQELALAIKHLVQDLSDYSDEGAEARTQRIATALNAKPTDPLVKNLAAELASASFVMQVFKQRYLPQLEDDMDGDSVSASDDEIPDTDWMTSRNMSGWRVDSSEGAISYRPVLHADGMLKHWIEAMTAHATKPLSDDADEVGEMRHGIVQGIYENLEADFKACTKCHSQQGDKINWTVAGRHYAASGYVKFNHRPHMAMLHESDNCTTCHVVNTNTGDEMVRGFEAHDKAVCESCHAPGNANNTCLNCHQYHEVRP